MAERETLVAELEDLGRHLDLGPDADLVDGVLDRIAAGPSRLDRGRSRRRWVAVAVAVAAAAVALVLAVPGPRQAVARLLGLEAVRLEATGDLPAGLERELDLGRPVDLDDAADLIDGELVGPDALGLPGGAFAGRRGVVSLVWPDGEGLPDVDGTGVGLVLTVLDGSLEEPFISKLIPPGTTVTQVEIDGEPGWWIDGPHAVIYLDDDGDAVPDSARLAGGTLLWSRDGTVLRLESGLDRDGALVLADSVAPFDES